MSIAFNNTLGVGYNFATWSDTADTTSVPDVATPSDAASGKLLLGLWAAKSLSAFSAQSPSLPNVTGDTAVTGSLSTVSGFTLDMRVHRALLSSSPVDCNWNESVGGSRFPSALVLVVTGHDVTTPISQTATAPGTGTTVTFPDTASVNAGDMVIRWVVIGKADTSLTFSGFTGANTIVNDPQSSNYETAVFVGYDIAGGSGAPGTKTLTLSQSYDWKAYTIVVAGTASSLSIGSVVQRRRPVGRGPLMRRFPGVFKRQVGSVRQRQVLLQLYSAPGIPLANTAVNFWTAPNEAAAAVDGVNPPLQHTTDGNGLVLLSGLIIAAGVGQVRCAIPGDVSKSRNVTVTFT